MILHNTLITSLEHFLVHSNMRPVKTTLSDLATIAIANITKMNQTWDAAVESYYYTNGANGAGTKLTILDGCSTKLHRWLILLISPLLLNEIASNKIKDCYHICAYDHNCHCGYQEKLKMFKWIDYSINLS